ncbi:hypothetical protein DSS3PM1_00083 [Bacteriophage DSS3_PM1]|nr:hypothetical protein DSS3PM1_00083 [Bacteriophage DSS3_PM1]
MEEMIIEGLQSPWLIIVPVVALILVWVLKGDLDE